MIIGLSFLVCLIGLILFLFTASGKINRVGEIMFGVGLFFVLANGDKIIKIVGG